MYHCATGLLLLYHLQIWQCDNSPIHYNSCLYILREEQGYNPGGVGINNTQVPAIATLLLHPIVPGAITIAILFANVGGELWIYILISVYILGLFLCIFSNLKLYKLECLLDLSISGDVYLCNEGQCGLRRLTPYFKVLYA